MSTAFALPLPTVNDDPALARFCTDVRPRALRMALLETGGNSHAAADIVQDSLARLIASYRHKPAAEWPPLFFGILRHRATDWHRRRRVEQVLDFFFSRDDEETDEAAPWESLADPGPAPDEGLGRLQLAGRIADAVTALSPRQRQAFLLREVEELSVIDTARAMGVSEGSAKTHHLRALTRLRELLHDHDPRPADRAAPEIPR